MVLPEIRGTCIYPICTLLLEYIFILKEVLFKTEGAMHLINLTKLTSEIMKD